jgi:hypothetical protein
VLAVKVDYEKRQATIGTEPGQAPPMDEIQMALESIGYRGKLLHEPE